MSESEQTELVLPNWNAFEDYLSNHPHEAAEVTFVESVVEPGMKAIDVGANMGVITMALSRGIGRRGKVCAFEPLPRYFRILEGNLLANDLHNAKAFQLALTDHVGAVDFYDKNRSSGIIWEEGVPRIEVASTTIDDFVDERWKQGLDLIAMDCEGSELLVLRGAENTLRSNHIKVFCEIHHGFLSSLGQSIGDVIEYLDQLGFEVQALSSGGMQATDVLDSAGYVFAWN